MKIKLKYDHTDKTDEPELKFSLGQAICMIGRMTDIKNIKFNPDVQPKIFEVEVATSSALEAITAMLTEALTNNNCEVL